MVPPATVDAATGSASDTNFLYGNREWFLLQNATTPRLQRFVIAGVKLGNRCRKNNADMRLKHVRDKIVACTFLYTQEKLHISPG